MRARRVLALLALVACSESAPKTENAALGGDVLARAGAEVVSIDLVKKVAIAQKISPREAALRLVDDAVAADAARGKGLDHKSPAQWNLTAARARIAADRFFAEAKSKGPPTDEEVTQLTQAHWQQVDRPPSIRTYHVLVCPVGCGTRMKITPESQVHAREVADAMRPALLGLQTTDEMKAKAESFPHPKDVEIRPQELPAIDKDGRSVEGPDVMDPAFTAGAWAMSKIGDTSPVVQTKFGFHIIRLVDRLPERRMSFENRRVAFAEETFAMRAAEIQRVRLEELKRGMDIQVSTSAERLMRTVTNPAETP